MTYVINKITNSTGPNKIPFGVWKEYADIILTPPVVAIWNLSLSMQQWPCPWKECLPLTYAVKSFDIKRETWKHWQTKLQKL